MRNPFRSLATWYANAQDTIRRGEKATQELMDASEEGEIGKVRAALKDGADIHHWKDEPIILAARNRQAEVVKLLIEAGADVHAGSGAPLRYMATMGDAKTVRLLLGAGADRNDVNWDRIRKHEKEHPEATRETVIVLLAAINGMTEKEVAEKLRFGTREK